MPRRVAVGELLTELKSFAARNFPKEEVDAYLSGTLVDEAALDQYSTYAEERYTRHLIHKDEDFELLIICWGSGQGAPIHGHEGDLCWARVERGKLRFSNYRIVSEKPLRLQPVGEPVDGSTGFLDGPAEIHAVENPVAFGQNAASLHLYSKPYSECDVYDSLTGPRRRVSLAYDTIHGEPVTTGS